MVQQARSRLMFSPLLCATTSRRRQLNLVNPSVETAIDLVPLTSKKREINTVLSNSFGFGRHQRLHHHAPGCLISLRQPRNRARALDNDPAFRHNFHDIPGVGSPPPTDGRIRLVVADEQTGTEVLGVGDR